VDFFDPEEKSVVRAHYWGDWRTGPQIKGVSGGWLLEDDKPCESGNRREGYGGQGRVASVAVFLPAFGDASGALYSAHGGFLRYLNLLKGQTPYGEVRWSIREIPRVGSSTFEYRITHSLFGGLVEVKLHSGASFGEVLTDSWVHVLGRGLTPVFPWWFFPY